MMLPKKYMTREAIKALKEYKYVSGEYSYGDRMLTPFWNYVVSFMPMWLAPNLITLIGLCLLILTTFMFLPFDLTMKEEFHPALSLFAAMSFFAYQTLDAIDGKQARRTGTSSPLGQLFDHGCDAWNTTMAAFIPLQILRTFPDIQFFLYGIGVYIQYYTTNYEEHHIGVMRTSFGGIGLTECQLFLVFILACEGFTGCTFSQTTISQVLSTVSPSLVEEWKQDPQF